MPPGPKSKSRIAGGNGGKGERSPLTLGEHSNMASTATLIPCWASSYVSNAPPTVSAADPTVSLARAIASFASLMICLKIFSIIVRINLATIMFGDNISAKLLRIISGVNKIILAISSAIDPAAKSGTVDAFFEAQAFKPAFPPVSVIIWSSYL